MEIFDVIDENGRPTGETVERAKAHRDGIWHRTAHVWIIRKKDGRPQVLLQKRSLEKDSFPGGLDTSSAGHIPAGSEPVESAIRELGEELGISAQPGDLTFIDTFTVNFDLPFHGEMFRDREIAFVYAYEKPVDEAKLVLQKEEVSAVEWHDLDETIARCRAKDPLFVIPPEGLAIAEKYIKGKYQSDKERENEGASKGI